MQRKSVVLPLPEAPMTTTASPLATSRSTPSRTRVGPKDFSRPRIETTGRAMAALLADIGKAGLEPAARRGERVVDGEIHERSEEIERQGLEGAADHLLDRQHEIDDADERDQSA